MCAVELFTTVRLLLMVIGAAIVSPALVDSSTNPALLFVSLSKINEPPLGAIVKAEEAFPSPKFSQPSVMF